jgi:hypothetical protein
MTINIKNYNNIIYNNIKFIDLLINIFLYM